MFWKSQIDIIITFYAYSEEKMAELLQYDNGLKVCVISLPVRSVMTGIWVGTGSKYENAENNGLSHFTEHVMFKGTKNMNAFEIASAFENYGAMVNAFTSKESTCYYYKCMDKYNENCFRLLSDIFFNSTFPEDELNKERKVIIEEINMVEDAPDEICSDVMFAAAYGDNSLGRTILGPKENVLRFKGDDVRKYMQRRHSSDNTVIVFAGNIDAKQADALVKKYAIGNFLSEKKTEVETNNLFRKNSEIKRIKDTEQTNIVLAYPTISLADQEGIIVQSVLSCLFGGGMSSRLFQSVRERRGLAYSIYTLPMAYSDTGCFTICLNNNPDNTLKALEATAEEIEKLADGGITDEELSRAKVQLLSSLAFSEENVQSQMMAFGKGLICSGRMYDVNRKIEMTEAVTREQVEDFVRKYFGKENLSAAYVGRKIDYEILSIVKK